MAPKAEGIEKHAAPLEDVDTRPQAEQDADRAAVEAAASAFAGEELEPGQVRIRINPQFWRTDVVDFGTEHDGLRVTHAGVVVDESKYEELAKHTQEYIGNDEQKHTAQIVVKA